MLSRLGIFFLFLLLISVFLLTRLYNIQSSLEFFGDIGRDHLELYKWWLSGQPPLLGPGISYFALHLPPIYFYLNYPIFLFTGFSPYSTLITLVTLYLVVFIGGVFFGIKQKKILPVLVVMVLIIFHPEYIFQNRLPWNPAFAPPFLLISVLSFLLLLEKYTLKKLIILMASLAVAVSLSVQVIPIILLFLFLTILKFTDRLKIVFIASIVFLIVYSPLIFFELRHNFFFLNRLIQNPIAQPIKADMQMKFQSEVAYIFGVKEWNTLTVVLVTSVIVIIAGQVIFLIRNRKLSRVSKQQTSFISFLLLAGLTITYLAPFPAREYDIFGVSVLLFSLVALLPWKISLLTTLLLLIIWNPFQLSEYFRPGHRTIAEMEACARLVCKEEKQPMFVTVQAWHASHQTPEYQFLFLKSGCQVKDVTHQPNWSSKMAVVADNSTYTHGQTSFNELTLFGTSLQEKVYMCSDNLKVHILQK